MVPNTDKTPDRPFCLRGSAHGRWTRADLWRPPTPQPCCKTNTSDEQHFLCIVNRNELCTSEKQRFGHPCYYYVVLIRLFLLTVTACMRRARPDLSRFALPGRANWGPGLGDNNNNNRSPPKMCKKLNTYLSI